MLKNINKILVNWCWLEIKRWISSFISIKDFNT